MDNDKLWDDYFISGTNTLKNKLGIVNKEELSKKEIELSFERLVELENMNLDLDFDKTHLKFIHYYLFQDIYDWAGVYRTCYMSKGNSYFAAVNEIDYKLEELLKEMKEDMNNLNNKYDVASFLSTYYIYLNQIHPFRDGNGRSIREFLREVCQSKDIAFSWQYVDKEKLDEYIDFSIAFRSQMEHVFYESLVEAERNNNYGK